MDVLPTLSKLIGVDLPTDRVYDGKDMTDVCCCGRDRMPSLRKGLGASFSS